MNDFISGLCVGLLSGLFIAFVFWFINYAIKREYDVRERKILDNVKSFLNNKGGK